MMLQHAQARLYLYAIVAGDSSLAEPLTGLADAPVTLLPYRAIAAAASPVEVDKVQPEPEQLLCHEQVIEALMTQRSTLPVRFGTVLSSAAKVIEALAERYDDYVADLERLAGQVEVGLRVLWDVETVKTHVETFEVSETSKVLEGDHPGTRYLLARAQEAAVERALKERAQALETWCRQRLGPLATDMTTRVLATDGLPVSAAFLVPREKVSALLAEADQMQRESDGLEFICTGPWPPYHFVERGA
jgi:hypothetical protein